MSDFGFPSKPEYVGALLDVLKMHKNLCLSRHFQQLDKESLFDTFRLVLSCFMYGMLGCTYVGRRFRIEL